MTFAEVIFAVLADLNAQLDQAYLALAGTVLDAQAYDDLAKHADETEQKFARLQRWYSTPPHERERMLTAEVEQLRQRIEVTDKVACGYLDERDFWKKRSEKVEAAMRMYTAARSAPTTLHEAETLSQRNGTKGEMNMTKTTKKTAARKSTKTSKTAKRKPVERHVLVTTAHRGVFAGYATDVSGDTIKLRAARLCLYWSTDVKGFMGLASTGPSTSCRIGPPADIELRSITAVAAITPEATAKWEAAPWKS